MMRADQRGEIGVKGDAIAEDGGGGTVHVSFEPSRMRTRERHKRTDFIISLSPTEIKTSKAFSSVSI